MIRLDAAYDRESFLEYLKQDFLPEFTKDVRPVKVSDKTTFDNAWSLGKSEKLGIQGLQVFEFHYTGSIKKRVSLTRDAFSLMREYATYEAIAVFRSSETDDWRLSLLTATPQSNQKGQAELIFSNPKRYSYHVGPEAKVNTPTNFLITKGKVSDFDDLKSRFSLEVVNKEFYQEIAVLFNKLAGGTRGKGKKATTYPALLRLPDTPKDSPKLHEFAVRLIGRIIFCWFLREKKSDQGISLMPADLLSLDALEAKQDYYHTVLEPIFFEILNRRVEERKPRYQETPYNLIPYLNGGLFTPQDDDYFDYDEGKQAINHNTVKVPDEWLVELFKVLELYNFTIDENTSYDEELSIDPEMLGRIFENLLAEINPETGESARKSTGSYYTPRVIVDYMIDESLLQYLKQKTGIDEDKLRAVISFDVEEITKHPLSEEEKKHVVDALETITILDPACGSGAFPIGALQKIVYILQQVDEDGQHWFEKQIVGLSPELKRVIEKEFKYENFDYIRKLGIIRKNIYGVDIQPIATEISRLRCFLTLVVEQYVDEKADNRGIQPLPNLDFKFVTANTLIPLPQSRKKNADDTVQMGMFEDQEGIDGLKDLRTEFFNAYGTEREELKQKFVEAQARMFQRLVESKTAGSADLSRLLSSWDPFGHDASGWFDPEWMLGITDRIDIVIGNPPYIASYGRQAKKFKPEDTTFFLQHYDAFSLVKKRKNISLNTVMLFLEIGIRFLKPGGALIYIVDQALLNVKVYKFIRELMLKNTTLAGLVTDLRFPQVIAEACIVHTVKQRPSDDYSFRWKKNDTNNPFRDVFLQSSIADKYYSITLSENKKIVEKIEKNSIDLCGCAETYTGMQIIPEYFLSDDDSRIDSAKWHKAVFSNNITNYCISWPADKQKGKYITYDNDLQTRIRKLLKERIANGEKVRSPASLSIGSPEKEHRFDNPKIIMSQTVSNANGRIRIQAALDNKDGYYGNVSIHIIKHTDLDYLKYLLAIINSRLISFYAVEKKLVLGAEPGSKKTPQIRKGAMDLIPVRMASDSIFKSIVSIVDEIHNYKDKCSSQDYLEGSILLGYMARIDQYLYEVYGLTEEEIAIVEGTNAR